jgi:hypothetical protein
MDGGVIVNIEETKKAIEVMQAFVDGKSIETRRQIKQGAWLPASDPSWKWVEWEYRVKPEPDASYREVIE